MNEPTNPSATPQAPATQAPTVPEMSPMNAAAPQAPMAGTTQPTPPSWARGAGTSKSLMTSGIVSIIAGAVSLILFPYIAGAAAVVMGIQTIKQYTKANKAGENPSGGALAMGIIGAVLGVLGMILAVIVKAALRY